MSSPENVQLPGEKENEPDGLELKITVPVGSPSEVVPVIASVQ
jgi:hypothetical protein